MYDTTSTMNTTLFTNGQLTYASVTCYNGVGLSAQRTSAAARVVTKAPSSANAAATIHEISQTWYPPMKNYQSANSTLVVSWDGFQQLMDGSYILDINQGQTSIFRQTYRSSIDKVSLQDLSLKYGHTYQAVIQANNSAGVAAFVTSNSICIGCLHVSFTGKLCAIIIFIIHVHVVFCKFAKQIVC